MVAGQKVALGRHPRPHGVTVYVAEHTLTGGAGVSPPGASVRPVTDRLLVWHVVETAGFDSVWFRLDAAGLTARGRATGQLPIIASGSCSRDGEANSSF
jgi:hypothetical protein